MHKHSETSLDVGYDGGSDDACALKLVERAL
jgi:hypothetical protein